MAMVMNPRVMVSHAIANIGVFSSGDKDKEIVAGQTHGGYQISVYLYVYTYLCVYIFVCVSYTCTC